MIMPSRSVQRVVDIVSLGQTGARGFFALTLEHAGWPAWTPGQFVMVRPEAWGQDITWARPLSISRVQAQRLVLFFQVVGRGTARLALLKPGHKVTVWGPLGNGFASEPETPTLLLAGGIGIAPFAGYVDRHVGKNMLSMVFGHRWPLKCYPADSLSRRVDMESLHEQSPEDLVRFQSLVKERMKAYSEREGLVLACGPMPFLRMVWTYASELTVRTQLSLEQRMACGVGACLGCVAVTSQCWPDAALAGLPVQTCTNGPVFWAEHLDLTLRAGE